MVDSPRPRQPLRRHRPGCPPQHDYQPFATESPDEAVLTRVDRIRNYGVDFGYRLKRETRIGFGVSWWDRESTYYPFRAYEDIRMGLTMAYEL